MTLLERTQRGLDCSGWMRILSRTALTRCVSSVRRRISRIDLKRAVKAPEGLVAQTVIVLDPAQYAIEPCVIWKEPRRGLVFLQGVGHHSTFAIVLADLLMRVSPGKAWLVSYHVSESLYRADFAGIQPKPRQTDKHGCAHGHSHQTKT